MLSDPAPADRPAVAQSSACRVRDSIPGDFPETGIHLRMALGAEIPDDVRLHEFPAIVVDSAPQLQDYRFLLAADQIVIVDPRDRSIALVLGRT